MVFSEVIKRVKFQKFKLIQWLMIRNLASSQGEVVIGLHFYSGLVPFQMVQAELCGERTHVKPGLERKMWKRYSVTLKL